MLVHARRLMLVGAVIPLVGLMSASPAMAEKVFEKFKECPTEVPSVALCTFGKTTSGEVSIGKTSVPITKTIVQQGGAISTGNPEQPTEYVLFPAKNGESLSKEALNVPGGLLDFVNCTEIKGEGLIEKGERVLCKAVFEEGASEVTATTELAANEKNPPILNLHNLSEEEGTALVLPVKIHLKNTFLGNSCYIGSEAHPIELHLTTGESGKAVGKRGHAQTLEEGGQFSLHLTENSLVDGEFTVPVVEGCGEIVIIKGILEAKGFLNSIVDGKLGLPSKAGNNVAKLDGELNTASAASVIAEGF
jgi:hypothetical protein